MGANIKPEGEPRAPQVPRRNALLWHTAPRFAGALPRTPPVSRLDKHEKMEKTRSTGSAGERLLRVLRTVVEADDAIALPEITEAVDLPKPTVHRLVTLLEDEGFVIREIDGRRYTPGPSMQELSYRVLQSRANHAARHSILERVAGQAKEACNLVILDGNHITYIDRIDAAWPLSIRLAVGSQVPIHCTATGKLLLSLQPKRVRDRLLANERLEAKTAHTITDRIRLLEELEVIRSERVGTDNEEFIEGMVAVSVPILPPSGAPVAAVSIHAPVFRTPLEELKRFIPALREAAEDLGDLVYT